jgi:hypothetical protein
MNFNTYRERIANAIYPRVNAKPLDPVGSAYPYTTEAYESRIDADKCLHVLEVGQVDRILYQVFNLIMNGRDIKIVTPEDDDAEKLQDKSNEVRKLLWRLDKHYNTESLMVKCGIDCMGFGSGLAEMGVDEDKDGNPKFGKTDYGLNAPAWINYLDAYSFKDIASACNNTQSFVPGRILEGIVWDIENKRMQYWQTPSEGATQVQIPTGRVIHVKDNNSRYPDGRSYLAGIAPTVQQLEFVRKAFMQTVNVRAVQRCIVQVKEMRDANGRLLDPPSGDTSKPRWYQAYKAGESFVKNYGNNNVGMLWEDHNLIFPNQGGVGEVTEPDQYLKMEILNHLIPRDFIEQNQQAISTTGAPLLELVMMVVHGWRQIIAAPFERLYTDILQQNGYQDWAVEFTFKDPNLENKVEKQKLALQAASLGLMPITRLYKEMGWQDLTKEELDELKEKEANAGGML